MAVRKSKEARKVPIINIGLEEKDDLSNVRIVDHLTPKQQKLFVKAKAFKDR